MKLTVNIIHTGASNDAEYHGRKTINITALQNFLKKLTRALSNTRQKCNKTPSCFQCIFIKYIYYTYYMNIFSLIYILSPSNFSLCYLHTIYYTYIHI